MIKLYNFVLKKISHITIAGIIYSSFLIPTISNGQSTGYNWNSVAIGGGGFVSAIITSKTEKNLMYARTDVGGAYRWNATTSRWIPLTDWASENETGYLGVESIAIDPQAPNKLYMLVGIDYFNSGKTAILRSDDYGNNFTVTDVTSQFKAHGNGMGRQTGEKLQVDPNNGTILYCGTRRNGLFKSTNSGASWARVSSLNVTSTPNDNGISFVYVDPSSGTKGNASQTIYVGISRFESPNIFVSKDGGATFNALAGAPTAAFMPQRVSVASDGTMFINFANGAGPHPEYNASGVIINGTVDNGAIWKFNTKSS
ncbi:MAG: exo-alpha-sialidase, partial [Opitutaceae bacterium]|nr:exo-alpha-sialidase [Cytophagales bacterium]